MTKPKLVINVSGGNIQGMSVTPGTDIEIVVVDYDNLRDEGLWSDECDAIANAQCKGLEAAHWLGFVRPTKKSRRG